MTLQKCTVQYFLLNQRPYRKIDVQEIFFTVVNWPNSELCGLYNTLPWLVCNKPAGQCFPGCGVWDVEDFDSKYNILLGETRIHGVPIHEERKKFQNKNLHNYSNISTPYSIRMTHVGGGEGGGGS